MRLSLLISTALVALFLLPAPALAQWSDNFDSYANGSALHGQGGWAGWNGDPNATAYVTNLRARSAPHSADIRPTSDIVQEFTGINSGIWIISGWCYVPSGITGQQYFILLNTYPAGANNNWSCQVLLDMTANTVSDSDNPNPTPLPLIRDRWVEVRNEINFGTDVQTVFYDGALLHQESWTAGTQTGGALNLAALDLFSFGGPRYPVG